MAGPAGLDATATGVARSGVTRGSVEAADLDATPTWPSPEARFTTAGVAVVATPFTASGVRTSAAGVAPVGGAAGGAAA